MIVVHQVPGAWGLPSVSPFCTKLQAYLRLAGLEHEVRTANMLRAPKGKVPYVSIDGGPLLGDSQLVIEELVRRFGDRLDGGLDASQRATGHLVRRTLEEATYFTSVYGRWVDPSAWTVTREVYRTFVPAFALPFIRRSVRQTLERQGTGRHAPADIAAMACADWSAVSTVLGDRPFLLGDRPTSFDCTVHAFVAGTLAFPHPSPVRAHVEGLANLVAYRDRTRARIFGG